MTSRQESKLNMFRATQKHCNDNPTIVETVTAFQNALKAFSTKIASIIATAQQEDVITTGVTIDKAEAKKSLCQLASDTAALVSAYAVEQKNNPLLKQVDFSYSDLFKSKDDELAPRCQNIFDAAKNNLAELSAYGVTQATIDSLLTAINNYAAKVPNPRNAAALKITIKANLKTLFAEADKILKLQMDKTAVSFKKDNAYFVKTYLSNRVIIDPVTKKKKAAPTTAEK